jgi:release factor glutamine methyltransferase
MKIGKKEIDWLLLEKYPRFLAEPKKYLPQIHRDLRRLKSGEPLAYVIGWVDFLGCKIDLLFRPLIPRPETEWWTEKAIARIRGQGSRAKVLDVFSGSGCVGIAILKHIPQAEVWFADSDPACLKQIRKNLRLNRIAANRWEVRRTDVLRINTSRRSAQNVDIGYFDYIFANPPYIPRGRRSKLPLSVRKYEKPRALFGGKDGLFYIRRLLKEVRNRLKPEGEIWLEFGFGQAAAVKKIAQEYGYICGIHEDQFRRPRYAIIRPA